MSEGEGEEWDKLTSFESILIRGSRIICSLDSASVVALVVIDVDVGAGFEAVVRGTLFRRAEEIMGICKAILICQYRPG